MYTIQIINENGELGKMFTLDLEGLNTLFKTATPFKVTFQIQKIS